MLLLTDVLVLPLGELLDRYAPGSELLFPFFGGDASLGSGAKASTSEEIWDIWSGLQEELKARYGSGKKVKCPDVPRKNHAKCY